MRFLTWMLATAGGLGMSPAASGTVASLVTVVVWFFLPAAPRVEWVAAVGVASIGVWSSGRFARSTGRHDPSDVVIDEVGGMWLTLAGMPHEPLIAAFGFALFRIFDIVKPPPIRQCERLPGGWGIMLDDLAAGLLARAVLVVGLYWLRARG